MTRTPIHRLSAAAAVGAIVGAITFIIALVVGVTEARPQTRTCMPWTEAKRLYADWYQERTIGGGLVDAKHVVEVIVAPDGKTFTIFVVSATGIACVIAAGTDWATTSPIEGDPS